MTNHSTTMGLEEAAMFLRCNKETVRRLAQSGQIPAGKVGRKWVLLQDDLENFIRTQYSTNESVVQVVDKNEESLCQSTSETISGGLSSPQQTEQEYNALLGLKTDNKH